MFRQNQTICADQIFYNGRIYTVDAAFQVFSAMAVKDGRIMALAAKNEEEVFVDQYGQPGITQFEDLHGTTVFPGMSDTHVHAPGLAYDTLFNVELYQALSKRETLTLIRQHVKDHPERELYYGRGVNSSFFGPEEDMIGPRKEHLDELSADKPIIIADFGGNYLWMNSAAFHRYGITADTVSPLGGEIPLDPADGSLWGIVRGEARALVPYQEFTEEQNDQAAKWFQEFMLSQGYTSLFALRPPGTVEPRTTQFSLFQALEKKGELMMRVHGGRDMDPNGDVDAQIEEMKVLREKYSSPLVQFTTAKFFLDGVIEGLDGHLLEPYEQASGKAEDHRGTFFWEEEKLAYAFQRCMEEGFQLHCHAIGDGATHKGLDAIEKATQSLDSKKDYRNTFTHLQLVTPEDVRRMKKNGVIANVQPYWHFKSPVLYHQIESPLLGQRAEAEYPLQSFFREGVVVTASSDYPVTPVPNPFYAIGAGVTRNLYHGSDFGLDDISHPDDPLYLLNKEERASVKDMVKAFTINAAYSRYQEDLMGSLEPGKSADFIVVSNDPFAVQPTEIAHIQILQTYFKGKLVFCR